MILQELNKYYHLKKEKDKFSLPSIGYEVREIHYLIIINENGEFLHLDSIFIKEGSKFKGREFWAPLSVERSSGVRPNLFCDNAKYVLGKGSDKNELDSFIGDIRELAERVPEEPSLQAVLKFYKKGEYQKVFESNPDYQKFFDGQAVFSFRLESDPNELICQKQGLRKAIESRYSPFFSLKTLRKENLQSLPKKRCLISGDDDVIAELHRSFGPSQIRGAKSTGGNLVSFNEQAYESFGKSQGYNSPIGVQSAFYYATALNYLLRPDSSQRIQVGDATTVFWAAQPDHPMETLMESLFGEPPKDDPDRGVRTVEALFKAPQTGTLPLQEDHTRFFVLGLSPNAARISVRFWHATTVGELARNIQKHFEDISICHAPYEKDYPSLFRLLVAAAVQGKSENIPPNLAGVVMKSILEGTPYPRALLATVLSRARAEQAKKDQKGRSAPNVSQPRAALIKACLNRHTRRFQPHEKEVTVSLDETNHNTGYLLGRLFAVLERTQEEANPGLNATIRDRFYGAGSTRPAAVFPNLLKLKNHHISKLDNRGRAVNLEKMIGGIIENVKDFSPVLSLEDQGRFAIGYYHQRQNFFNKTEQPEQGE